MARCAGGRRTRERKTQGEELAAVGMLPLNETSWDRDAALYAHDSGAGAEAIVRQIEGEDPVLQRLSEREQTMAGALLELIRKLVIPKDASQTSKRFVSLVIHLCPDVLQLSQLAAAKQIGVTRASLSKHSIKLAEEFGLGHARWRKCEGARSKYRDAQLRAVAAGTHASFKRKGKPQKRRKALSAVDTIGTHNERTRTAHPNISRPATPGASKPQHPSQMDHRRNDPGAFHSGKDADLFVPETGSTFQRTRGGTRRAAKTALQV